MADNTLKVRLQSAYKSSADWDTLNPVLKNGEVGYVSSPASMYGWYKIGNGTSTWNQLPYSTYRPLNNGDFDTINVTDETAGDLIVTGAARFLNTIQGTAASAVNAGTASSASNAAKVSGTLTITQAGTTKLNAWNGSAATSIALTDNNDTYKFASSTSGVVTAIVGLKANGASTFDTSSTVNLASTSIAYPIINSLSTGRTQATTADYLIGSYAGAGTPTTSWWRKQAKLITVGKAEYATSAGAAPYPVTAVIGDSTWTTVTSVDNAKKFKVSHIGGPGAAATVGATATASGLGASVKVPYIALDAKGHATSSNEYTFTSPTENEIKGVKVNNAGSADYATNASQLGGTVASSYATKDYVTTEIAKLGQPMHYMGTITTATGLPASPAVGDTYKVAEEGDYGTPTTFAKVGDMFIYSSDSSWQYIPSADEDAVMSVEADETYVTTVGSQSASAVKISHNEKGYTFASTAKYGSSAAVPIITIDKAGHIAAISTVTVKDNNSNYYTTALQSSCVENGHAIIVKGNHANVKGTAVIPYASSTECGVIKGTGTSTDFLDGTCVWRGLATSDITDFNTAVIATKVDNAVNADTVNNLTVQTAVPANAVFTDTLYSAGDKISLGGINSTVINHTTAFSASGSMTAGTAGTADTWGESISFTVPEFNYDKWGHLTSTSNKTFKVAIPDNPNSDTCVTQTPSTVKTYLLGTQSSTVLSGAATTTSRASTAVYVSGGDMVMSGKLTVGGNDADTTGVRMQYNSTTKSLDFVFA